MLGQSSFLAATKKARCPVPRVSPMIDDSSPFRIVSLEMVCCGSGQSSLSCRSPSHKSPEGINRAVVLKGGQGVSVSVILKRATVPATGRTSAQLSSYFKHLMIRLQWPCMQWPPRDPQCLAHVDTYHICDEWRNGWMPVLLFRRQTQHLEFHPSQRWLSYALQGEWDHSRILCQSGMLFGSNLHLARGSRGHSQRKRGFSRHPSSSLCRGGQRGTTTQALPLRSCITGQCYGARVRTPALLLPTPPTCVIWARDLTISPRP